MGYYLATENDSQCRVWNSDLKKTCTVLPSRIDDSVGVTDEQYEEHVNTRDPQPDLDVPDEQSKDSDSDNEDDDNDDAHGAAGEVLHHYSHYACMESNKVLHWKATEILS